MAVPLHIQPLVLAISLINYIGAVITMNNNTTAGGGESDNVVTRYGQATAGKADQSAFSAFDGQRIRLFDTSAKPACFFGCWCIRQQAPGNDEGGLIAQTDLL